MGQSTFATIGVSVSLELTYRNIQLIKKLLEMDVFCVYISGLKEYSDEIVDFDQDELDFSEEDIYELSEKQNEEDFNKHYEELELEKYLVFIFIYNCTSVYARNLSFRNTPTLFSHNDYQLSPTQTILKFQKGLELFKEAGVEEEYIKVGNTINES